MPQNDKFIKDIYTLVSQNGFQGSEENALELLETNERFQQDVLKGIKAKGFNGELEDMLNLSGISLPEKKSPDEPLESSLEETSTDTTEESGAGEESFVDSSIDYVSNTVSALDRGFYKNFIGNPVKGLGTLLQGTSAKITGTDGKGVISDALIKLGTYINDTVDELAPQDEDFKNSLTDQTAQALGQVGALIATGGVSGAASKAPMLAAKVLPKGKAILEVGKDLGKQMVSPVAVSGGLSMGQSEYERAISSGATEDQAFEAFYRNAAVGSVLERVPTMQFFKRFNTVTKGGVADYLKRKGFAGFTGGLEEATTEILQGIYANKTAKEIYNVNQEIFEGVGEQGGMGFGIGFLLNALGARATLARTNNNIAEADLLDAQVEEIKTKAEGKNSKPDQKSKVTMHTPTVSSQEIDDMIDNGDLAGIEQMTKEGKIKWETIPEKTKARVPSNLLPPKVDVKQDVELEQQANEQTTENPTGVPSIDEGAESTTQPINEEAGSPTKESTNQQDQITIEDLAKTATTVSDPNKQADEITQEDIDYATSQIELGVLNWDGNPMTMRVDLGIERADVRKGEADIKRGKPNSAPAKRLIGALRDAKKRGQYDFFSGSGSNISRQNVPITEEFLGEVELTQNQVEDINTDEASLETEYNEWFNALDEESQNEILQDYEENNPGETGSDAQGRESQENVPNQTESGRGVEEERNIEQLEGYQDLIFEVSELVDTQEQVNQDPDVQSKDVDQEVQKYLDQSEFYQQATDVEKEKIFRDTQELMVKDKIPTPSANALISKDIKAQKRADLKQNTASKTKELKRVAAKKRRELKKVGDSKSAKSKKLRDEINSKYAIEASNIQEANKVQADAINAKYDAELDQLKPSDEVTFREKTGLKKQIRDLARGAKLFKKGLNEKKVELKEIIDALPWVGKLSASQTKVLINKFNKTDLLNEKAVQKFMSYTEKVLADKAFADSINNANKKRKVALKNIKRKLGTLPNSYDSFKALFSINSSLIPDSLLDSYINLNNKFGERKAVLNPGEISEATNQANKILDALDKETSEANKLQLEYDSFIKNNPQKDDVTFADKIELMKKAEVISKEEAELMEKYESIIDPKEKKTPEEDLQARKENISVITKAKRKGDDGKSIANNITNPHEKEVAENFLNLTKDKKTLEELPTNVLEHIEKIIDNIKDGFFPSYGLKLTQQMDAITRGDIMIDVIDNVPPKSRWNKFWDGFSLPKKSIQSWLTGKTVSLINIRGNILENIDETLGNFKDKKIFNNSFGSFAKSYSGYAVNSDKVNEKAIDLMNILEKEHSKDQNKIVKSKYKVWAYLMQKEYESNPGSKKVFTAKEAIDSILDYGREQGRISDQTLSKKDYEILQEIADDFLGNEDAESLYKSMSKGEKKVAGIIREVNDGLKDKTMFNGAMLGSSRPEHFNDYHHHNTLRIEGRKDKGLDDANTGSGNVGSDGTAIERISGIKPLNPDPILAMALGAKQTLREFHLKNELQTVQEGIKRLNYKYQQPEYKGTRERKQANAVRDAFKEVVDIIKEGENRNASKANVRIDRIEEFGYYSILGSVPRAAGELGTNLAYAMIANPVEYTSGIAKYKDYYMGTRGRDVMENSKSYQTTKNYGKNVRGKLGDANAFIEQEGVSKTKARADWQNKVMQITGHIKLRSATKTISKVLLTTPDMMIARPLWFGSYAAEFKRQSGKDVDYEKIADNDTDYMRENKIAIDEATKHADNQVKQSSTTNNKTLGVLKNKAREGDNALVNVYKRADRAMVNFMLYEFATAKTAVHTMMKEGSVNKRKGAALLTGIGLRMALYMPLVTAARNGFKNVLSSALGGEEEKDQEDDYLDMFKRQGLGSLMSLVLGRNMGNIGRIPISIGVEILNEEYLEGLRNGEEYDPYKHSLMYQAVTPDQLSTYKLPSTILYRFSGAYSPIIKSSIKAFGGGKDVFVDNFFDKKEPTYKTSKYQKQKKAREQKHMDQAMKGAIETMGVMGIIPFYKDAKDYVGRNDFKGKK